MISVHLLEDALGPVGFECVGHAGYAAEDQDDVICASITAIAGTTVTGLTDILQVDVDYTFNSGHLQCEVLNRKDKTDEVSILFRVFEIGCKQIEFSYGSQFVHVTDPEMK